MTGFLQTDATCRSVLGRTLRVVDDDDINRAFRWLQLQAELLLQCREDGDVRPPQFKVVAPFKSSPVNNAALRITRQALGDVRHRAGTARDDPTRDAIR